MLQALTGLFDKAPLGIIVLDRNGVVIYINQRQCEHLKLEPADFLGKHFRSSAYVTFERAGILPAFDRLLKEGIPLELTLPRYRRYSDGAVISFTMRGFRHEGLTFLFTSVDQALSAQLDRYEQLFENANDGIFILSREGKFVAVNQKWCEILGFPRDQILGQTTEIVLPGRFAQSLDRLERILREGRLGPYELEITTPAGRKIISLNGFALYEDGQPAAVMNIARDVTERKRAEETLRESEERFRSLAAFAPIGIFRTDAAGRVLYTNPRWQQMAGLSLEQSLSEGWAVAIHPEDLERVRQEWERCTREVTDYDGEFRFQTAQGEVRWVHTTAAAVRSPSGEVLGYVGTNQDISERKVIEQLRSDLVRMLSHDLKNPLAAILGFSDILREDLGDRHNLGEAIDAIESSAQQAMSLALNFLEADRIESGALQIRKAPTSLNEIVKHVVRQQGPRARLRKVELRADLDASLQSLDLDTALVDRVATNLVSNAIKFSAPGTTVHVETRRQDSQAVLAVRDNGPGITAEDRKRLFRRYGRGSTARPESTGLGLFIVKTIVEAHGGGVDVRCPPDGGSVFEVSFPMAVGVLDRHPNRP